MHACTDGGSGVRMSPARHSCPRTAAIIPTCTHAHACMHVHMHCKCTYTHENMHVDVPTCTSTTPCSHMHACPHANSCACTEETHVRVICSAQQQRVAPNHSRTWSTDTTLPVSRNQYDSGRRIRTCVVQEMNVRKYDCKSSIQPPFT